MSMATPSPPRTRKKSSLSQDGRTTQRTATLREETTLQRADTATSAGEPSSPLRLKIKELWRPDDKERNFTATVLSGLKMTEELKENHQALIDRALAKNLREDVSDARRRWDLVKNSIKIVAAFSQLAARLELYYDSDDEELLMEAECDREAHAASDKIDAEKRRRAAREAWVARRDRRHWARQRRVVDLDEANSRRRRAAAERAWFVILPTAPWKVAFDIGMLLLVVFIMFYIPYIVAFVQDLGSRADPFDVFNFCYFTLDIILSFITAYEDMVRDTLVVDPRKIVVNYLTSFFVIDFVSTIPFEFFITSKKSSQITRSLRFIKCLKLLKLLKVGPLRRTIKRFWTRIRAPPGLDKGLSVTFAFCAITHLFACIWKVLGSQTDACCSDADCCAGDADPMRKCTWLQKGCLGTNPTPGDDDMLANDDDDKGKWAPNAYLYTTCLYFTVTTLSTVGYGDYSPNTLSEKVFGIITEILGVTGYAYIIAFLSDLLSQMDTKARDRAEKEDELDRFVNKHALPFEVTAAMQAHQRRYLAAAHLWRDADTRSLVEELPPSLRTAVVLHVEKGLLSKIPFFHGTRRSFVADAVLNLRSHLVSIDEVVVPRGEITDAVYFVVDGAIAFLASAHASAHRLGEIPAGAHFGAEGPLLHAAWTVELRGARATQMQRLDVEFLLPLLDKYPLVRWEITGIAEKRLRESTLLQVVPKEQTRLPSSACLSQSFSYHADLLEDDGDGLRTPPGARGGAGQLIRASAQHRK